MTELLNMFLEKGSEEMGEEKCVSPRYPECDKLDNNWKAVFAIQQFLEWLSEQKMTICELLGKEFPEFQPVTKNAQDLVYDYFRIDANKLERERRAMLEEQRKRNAKETYKLKKGAVLLVK